MVDRHWIADLSLAVLVALPLVALAWSHATARHSVTAPAAVNVATADRLSPANGRISLFG